MEPLSSQARINTDRILTALYFFTVWVPLLYAFVSLGLNFSFEALNLSFFYLLTRSTLFGLIQAFLSVLLIAFFSFSVGYFKIFNNLNIFSFRLFTFVSIFLFSLSPTLSALSILNLINLIKIPYSQGLPSILFCHFMMNGLFVSFLFMKRVDRFMSPQTKDLDFFLRSLGSSRINYLKYFFWPLFKNDFFSWAPQVFFWCFNSFAPILLLAESTQQVTPEILFYYSILNDRSGGRILFIFFLNLFLGIFFNRVFEKSFLLQENYSNKIQTKFFSNKKFFSVFISFFCILFFLPFGVSLLQAFRSFSFQNSLFFSKDLWDSFLISSAIALLAFTFSFIAGFLCLIAKQNSFVIKYSNILSPPFILLGWLELGFNSSNNLTSVFIISLASFLTVFPWFYRQLKSQREQFPQDLASYCLTLGMTPLHFIRKIIYPFHKETLLKLASVTSLWAFGEYAFSKVFFNKSQSLPLFIDENLRRYNFDASSLGILLFLFGSFILISILFKNDRASLC
jgi:ABC-type Fe3+ transport system permease subunit